MTRLSGAASSSPRGRSRAPHRLALRAPAGLLSARHALCCGAGQRAEHDIKVGGRRCGTGLFEHAHFARYLHGRINDRFDRWKAALQHCLHGLMLRRQLVLRLNAGCAVSFSLRRDAKLRMLPLYDGSNSWGMSRAPCKMRITVTWSWVDSKKIT